MSLQKQSSQAAVESLNTSSDSADSTCVVCFKNFDIFSIGECDHPVCYECSTRMRVLCQQNECPICRHGLSKVIFTVEKKSYRELEAINRSEYYNKKYKICFLDMQIQKAFYDLLENPCPKCLNRTFSSFESLKDHVRKHHELFYCDICTENLKIFSFERKCYNRHELGMHRRKGDPDNTSHRGHPLCEYCDCRYLDRDELFRHLRREHYYCHFCDADGANQFYGNIDSLRDHFRSEHYVCEEGDCVREQFTSVFRTDIDLRAHIANTHGKSMGKQQAKQARTLQLEITLGPRGRSHGNQDNSSAHLRSRSNEYLDDVSFSQPQHQAQNARMIDARNEQEFPSLGGTGASSGMTLVPQAMSIRAKAFGPAGLARTKENFPALGNNGNSKMDTGPNLPSNAKPSRPVSDLLKNNVAAQQKPNKSMIIHVSNRPNNVTAKVPNQKDFPALPGSNRNLSNFSATPFYQPKSFTPIQNSTSSKQRIQSNDTAKQQPTRPPKESKTSRKIDEDFSPSTAPIGLSAVAAKHRSLVDDYVSVAPSHNSKFSLVQKEEKPNRKANVDANVKLNANDFPALALSTTLSEPTWVKSQKAESRKLKVAPPPLVNTNAVEETHTRKNQEKKDKKKNLDSYSQNNVQNDKKQNKSNEKKQNEGTKGENASQRGNENTQIMKKTKDKIVSDNNNQSKTTNKTKTRDKESNIIECSEKSNGVNAAGLSTISSTTSIPPGFDYQSKNCSAPPGFKSVTLNSIAKPTNNLTFTNSLGEDFSILPSHQFTSPPDSLRRNQELVKHFQSALQSQEAVAEFRYISQKFREGIYKPSAFFEHCQAALKEKFDDIFPELLVLLPDISRQQELYLVYSQYLNSLFATPKQQKVKAMLCVCKTCKQIVMKNDLMAHRQAHNLDCNFPTLNEMKNSST